MIISLVIRVAPAGRLRPARRQASGEADPRAHDAQQGQQRREEQTDEQVHERNHPHLTEASRRRLVNS
jgi:hypothetical protein